MQYKKLTPLSYKAANILDTQDWKKGQDRIIELSNIVRDDEGKVKVAW